MTEKEAENLDEPKKSELNISNVMLRFKLRLNVEEWGIYKKGDEDYFNIKLHDKQDGLTRLPIDKRWDIISCDILNVAQLDCGRNITTCVFYKEGGKCSNLEYCRDQTT